MRLITKSDINSNDNQNIYLDNDIAANLLRKSAAKYSTDKNYDVFLSHSYNDAKEILDLKEYLEKFGLVVYVDWIEDYQLHRDTVDITTAGTIRTRMKNCKSLFYVVTHNTDRSKWMPWELGYFDGYKNKVAILPLVENVMEEDPFAGLEYLNLYPYVILYKPYPLYNETVYICDRDKKVVSFTGWLNNETPSQLIRLIRS